MIVGALALGVLIGLSLGALGGGGSILTVPALVYALGESAQKATTGSLVIVGITAAAATVGHARAGHVRWGSGFAFGAAGVVASFAGTALNAKVDPHLLLVCFAGLMVVAASAMLVRTRTELEPAAPDGDVTPWPPDRAGSTLTTIERKSEQSIRLTRWTAGTAAKVIVAGLVVGFLTGFLGVGGGFIVVPALVLALAYDMPVAVGTSLLIISLNSGVALLARSGHQSFHWALIVPFTIAAVAGSAAGKRVADRASGAGLTRAFAVLLLLVAGYVVVRAMTN